MALLINFICSQCKTEKSKYKRSGQIERYDELCSSCEHKNADVARTTHLDALKKLSIEERLAKIEEFIYEHNQVKHGYIPEPRF